MGESRADLLRAFKARLFDGQQQLLDLRRARESACSAWIERTKTLEASLDYAHETCATLRRNSAALDKSNAELRRRGRDGARTRERQLLEVVLAKRETEALRQALAVEDDEEPEARRRREKRLAALEPNARAAAAPERLVELRAAIDSARARAAAARAAYAGDVQVQTELRALLDTFAGDVRHQLERRKRKAHARPTSASAAPRVREKPDTLRISASTNALAPAWARSLPTKSPRPSTVRRRAAPCESPRPREAVVGATFERRRRTRCRRGICRRLGSAARRSRTSPRPARRRASTRCSCSSASWTASGREPSRRRRRCPCAASSRRARAARRRRGARRLPISPTVGRRGRARRRRTPPATAPPP
ncbi:hypothetical protein M885DRAFT_530118 [Pelagophyceae sp. CCMP2097]|nr:hypothetical protein M885DRAFT_530118 [Pelagophyceae sp. CCMP2097]